MPPSSSNTCASTSESKQYLSLQDRKKLDKQRKSENDPSQRLLIADLPGDLQAIYTRTLRSLVPSVKLVDLKSSSTGEEGLHAGGKRPRTEDGGDEKSAENKQKSNSKPKKNPFPGISVTQEVDGAVLALTVNSKHEAKQLFDRLQNCKVFGRRLKVEYHPISATMCKPAPTAVSVLVSEACGVPLVHRQLSSLSGFLDLEPLSVAEKHNTAASGDQKFLKFVASFADEGSAMHARALLSGRVIGTSSCGHDCPTGESLLMSSGKGGDEKDVFTATIGMGDMTNIHMFLTVK